MDLIFRLGTYTAKMNTNIRNAIIKINADDFNKVTLGNAKVQSVRNSWIDRAMKAGMSEASAKKVVNDINN
jgi:hypothetical protein